ncbi:methyl-accepting chemotaxis protein [Leptolyngbya sp. NIES-2104]|uniref:methyl-accepting chemotaxis protein n=1 Tax=Leptolyngbya sp. NIES-2104 TaxID=1552121 RepID=UPI0006EC792A|nr:methyl-accepting chemotaxis protein [Leptolyngbya sp. NIES-2104]GAP98853.1 methyl-accepting chemotaxis protein [Leptolyngbya sp. NIES-2104]
MVDQLNTAQRDQPVESAVIELPSKATIVKRPPVNQVPAIAALRRLSLRTKATVLAIAIGTLPVIGIGAIAYSFANRSITKQIISAEETLATTLSQRVTSFMAERTADMQVLSTLPVLTVPNVRDAVSQDEKRGLLERFVEANTVYDSVALFDLNGNVVFQNDRTNIPSQGDQDYFRSALQSNRVSISRPVRAENGEYVVYITAPVQENGSNRRTGILRAVMPIKSLAGELQNYNRTGAEFSVLDASNQIFLSSQESKIGQIASSVYSQFSEMQSRRSLNSRVINSKIGNDTEQVLSSFVPWTGRDRLPDLGWDVVLSVPTETAFEPQRQLLWTFLLGTGAVVVLTGLLAKWLADRATRPILAATSAVKELGEGKLDTRVAVRGEDEIGVLGSNINSMAGQLQTYVGQQTESAERARLLNQIVVKIRRSLSPDDIFTASVDEIREFMKVDRVVIYRFAPDYLSGTITTESVAPGWTKAFGKIINDPMEASLVDRYRDGRVWSMEDLRKTSLTHCHCEILERLEVQANVVAPVLQNKELIGLICAHQCSGPRQWKPEEIDFFGQLAAQIGYALDQALLLQQTEEARKAAELLSEERQQQKEELQMQLIDLLSDVEGAVDGDLTVRADVTAGEIGTVADFFNSIVESLRQIVTQVKSAAVQVNDSLNSDEQAIRQLSEEAVKQADETTNTLNSVQTMVRSIQTVSNSAKQAAHVAREASSTAEAGGIAMELTVQNILGLRDTIGETAKKVKRLGESSQQISKVVSLINQIAMQTNLLAINAGIEAARADEGSQGFSLVAEEVGELAARSAAATREIEQIVATIQRETSEVVEAMEQGTSQVVEGTRLVDNAKQSLEQILSVSRRIDDLVQSISDATVTQVQTSDAVTQLMQEIVEAAGRTSAASLDVSRSLRQTVGVAKELQESVGTFKVG